MPATKHWKVAIKRAYEPPAPEDGERILVDRLWPRGVSKANARLDLWLKDIAPSAELRTWFGHDPAKYDEFRRRYLAELQEEPGKTALATLREHCVRGQVTLVYAAREAEHNDATVLRDLLNGAR
ncbi:MAG: DUF488 family protein [Chloroflexota bacterium]|nr:DUF488 family protein [Chloroflexota bacterium]